MELKEIIAEIIEKKFPELPETQRPRALAKVLDVGEMDARRLIVAGRNQEKQFAIFMKLLPLCRDLGINSAWELIDDSASQQEKRMNDARMLIEGIGKANAVSKDAPTRSIDKIAQRGEKHFPSGRTPGHQRRKSRQK